MNKLVTIWSGKLFTVSPIHRSDKCKKSLGIVHQMTNVYLDRKKSSCQIGVAELMN